MGGNTLTLNMDAFFGTRPPAVPAQPSTVAKKIRDAEWIEFKGPGGSVSRKAEFSSEMSQVSDWLTSRLNLVPNGNDGVAIGICRRPDDSGFVICSGKIYLTLHC